MIRSFKVIAALEGISLLTLLFIAMPLKYIFDMPAMVHYNGMAHGLLFITYVVMAFVVKSETDWDYKKLMIVLFASVVPFGTFYVENKYLRAKA